jgi:Ca2+-binding RTX toxin-like protein
MAELPSTDYDEEIEMTDGTDAVLGGDGNTLILAQANSFTTLNDSDVIDGGGGTNTTRFASSGDDDITISNFTQTNVQTWETRNQVDGDVEVFFSFTDGIETFWWNGSYGDYSWYFDVQDPADLVFSSGDTAVDIDFANSVSMDMLDILLDGGAEVDDLYVNYYMGNMIPNVAVHSQGGGTNDLGLWAWGATGLTLSGDTDLDIEHWNSTNDDDDDNTDLSMISSKELAGASGAVNLNLEADVGDNGGPGPVSVLTQGDSFDTLDLDFDGSSDGVVKTGKRKDDITINNSDDLELRSGNGGDTIDINNADGNVLLGSGKGKDTADVHTINGGNLTGDMGTSNHDDTLRLDISGSVGTALNPFLMGGGDDTVEGNSQGSVGVDLNIDLGDGDNYIWTWNGRDANITALDGDDYAYITVGDDLVASFGGGDDDLYMDVNDNLNPIGDPFYAADINMGAGEDFVRADVNGNLKAVLGADDDVIGIPNVSGVAHIKAGGGDDQLRTGFRGIESTDSFVGGNGMDTIFAKRDANSGVSNGLEALNEAGDFGQATSTEIVSIIDDQNMAASQSVNFDGGTTGANTAGVRNYLFDMDDWEGDGQILSNYNLTNIASGSTLDIGLRGGSLDFFNLDLVAGVNTSAMVNLYVGSSTTWQDFDINDAATLTFNAMDVWSSGTPTVTIGTAATFTGNGLSTLNLTGNSHITMQSVVSPSLASIAAGGMTGNAHLTLTNVAGAIAVTTGTGSDTIIGNDLSTAYTVDTSGGGSVLDGNDTVVTRGLDDTITTGAGNDSVTSGAGIDTIIMGSGNDTAWFAAADLTAADSVDGGSQTSSSAQDFVRISSGELDRNDEFFFQWNDIEHLVLTNAQDDLVVGAIANAAGIDEITLNGGGDTLNLVEGFLRDLEVNIAAGATTLVDATGATLGVAGTNNDLTITGIETAFDATDTLMAGTGTNDTLQIWGTNAGNAVLGSMVTGFERAVTNDSHQTFGLTTHDNNVAAGKTMVIDLDAAHSGTTNFDGSAELDGNFNVMGSTGGVNSIMTGAGNDTITAGWGNDTIDAGVGNNTVTVWGGTNTINTYIGIDTINGGTGNDTINAGGGNDIINSGSGVDTIGAGMGNDTVNAGAGADLITGGLGADTLSGGTDSDMDTFFYTALLESSDGTLDTITDFQSGEDKIDFSGLVGGPVVAFVGNGTDPNDTTGLLSGAVEAVFELQTDTLWVNLDGNTSLDGNDLRIVLTGVGQAGGLAVDGSDLIV